MKKYYESIQKASCEFTAKNHYAPSVIYMNEGIYCCLSYEMFGNQWWILIHDRRILGMKILFDNNICSFTLK
jgi:hypothetical protein